MTIQRQLTRESRATRSTRKRKRKGDILEESRNRDRAVHRIRDELSIVKTFMDELMVMGKGRKKFIDTFGRACRDSIRKIIKEIGKLE